MTKRKRSDSCSSSSHCSFCSSGSHDELAASVRFVPRAYVGHSKVLANEEDPSQLYLYRQVRQQTYSQWEADNMVDVWITEPPKIVHKTQLKWESYGPTKKLSDLLQGATRSLYESHGLDHYMGSSLAEAIKWVEGSDKPIVLCYKLGSSADEKFGNFRASLRVSQEGPSSFQRICAQNCEEFFTS